MIGWVVGAPLTDPRVAEALAAALADAGVPAAEVTGLHAGDAPAVHVVAVGVAGPVRVVVGRLPDGAGCTVVEANVDDLDPRLWPDVVAALLEAGALDAWLVPVQMKKGRPAVTVAALCAAAALDPVRRVLLTRSSTIGVRETPVARTVLERTETTVEVEGHAVRVKSALLDGAAVNVMPEYDDVLELAALLGRPPKQVLLTAHAAALHLWRGGAGGQGG